MRSDQPDSHPVIDTAMHVALICAFALMIAVTVLVPDVLVLTA